MQLGDKINKHGDLIMKISQAATYEGDCQLYECSTDPEGIETDAWSIEDGGEKLNLKLIRMSVT